ncbi:unnamed protein product [Peniophora sp. CBMAI 1063]|nr:unnamed protein product [Peniophora sp. CBMAI 1063]
MQADGPDTDTDNEEQLDEAGFVHSSKRDPCGETWKAANGKEMSPVTKRVLEQSGIFTVVCRHGIVEKIIEMVQSGKLAKYPLAAAHWLLDTYGDNQTLGYDIGCVFVGTLRRFSFGDEATRCNLQVIVDAFHC